MPVRIKFLEQRDGVHEAKLWCKRTAELYAIAVSDPTHYASREPFRRRFKSTVKVFTRYSDSDSDSDSDSL